MYVHQGTIKLNRLAMCLSMYLHMERVNAAVYNKTKLPNSLCRKSALC